MTTKSQHSINLMCHSIFFPSLTQLSGLQKRTYIRNNWSKARGGSSASVHLGLPSGFLFGEKHGPQGDSKGLFFEGRCSALRMWNDTFFALNITVILMRRHSSKNPLPVLSELTCSQTKLIVINCLPKIPIPLSAFSKQLSSFGAQLLTFKKNWKWVCGKRAMRRSLWGNAME